jgi:glycyl-tRNA synthetase beta chain
LAKADLTTEMVGEFPELQGVMGMYYALHDGETEEIAKAIEGHYHPRFAGDSIPSGRLAQTVALADKLHTLVGIFGAAQVPTGDKDPFALRRTGQGIIRILVEGNLPLDIGDLLTIAKDTLLDAKLIGQSMPPLEGQEIAAVYSSPSMDQNALAQIPKFIDERAKSYLRELGYSVLEVESVLDLSPRPLEYVGRLEAVRQFLTLPEAAGLAEADKRIRNILNKSDSTGAAATANLALLREIEENQLLTSTRQLRTEVDALLARQQFSSALQRTAQLHQPVTQFFDKVMVNVDDQALRNNRFALLHEVASLTNQVVNISKLAA